MCLIIFLPYLQSLITQYFYFSGDICVTGFLPERWDCHLDVVLEFVLVFLVLPSSCISEFLFLVKQFKFSDYYNKSQSYVEHKPVLNRDIGFVTSYTALNLLALYLQVLTYFLHREKFILQCLILHIETYLAVSAKSTLFFILLPLYSDKPYQFRDIQLAWINKIQERNFQMNRESKSEYESGLLRCRECYITLC